ncbi:hypothetical protein K456DRAFT_1905694 [Colletotrichum gloeosporioides 23]|nr:hypothetical protein K456DRAFT_1905694 [Colletotrichum gloeosporioides 23]
MSVLCKRCEVIRLNDAEHNGFVQVAQSGKTYLGFEFQEHKGRLFLDYELKDSFPDLPVLSRSSLQGCTLCTLLKDEITKFRTETWRSIQQQTDLFIHKLLYSMSHTMESDEVLHRCSLEALLVHFKLSHPTNPNDQSSHALRLDIQAEPTDPCTPWLSIPRAPVEKDILSERGIRRLNQLKDIAFSIPNLPPILEHPRLPTRLIDVGLRGLGKSEEEPRLVVTSDYPPLRSKIESHHYIALSYCWGPPEKALQQLKTEILTLKNRLHQIPFTEFPKAHQDAIKLCRALSVRYIWIDSLCIIQDDTDDWEREAAQMGNVYANAYLTVCAAQGDSCLDGFLQRPRVNFNDYFNPNPPPPNPYRWTVGSRKPYKEDVNQCSWNGRGWTFQEFLLSPRILLFGKSMVHYLLSSRHGNTKESEEQMLSDWQGLVTDYSRRSLTYSNDILPAVSALAKLWAGKVEGEYLAGVFSSNLHRDLLWAHEGMRTPAEFLNQRPEQYTAPSWSWASQSDSISWVWHAVTTFKPEFHLMEGKVSPKGLDPYGRVKSGHLLLSTKIQKIPITRLQRGPEFLGYIFPYKLVSEDGTPLAYVRFDWRSPNSEAPKDPDTGEECENGPVDQLLMVLISSKVTEEWYKRAGSLTYQDLLWGLLVLPTSTPGEYRRAGVFFTEASGQCGRAFWDQCSTQEVKLV